MQAFGEQQSDRALSERAVATVMSINDGVIEQPAASPRLGDSGTFLIATWNIRCGRNLGLASAAKGLAQMGVGCALLMEVNITDDRYPKFASGYKIISSKATSHNQGGIALIWKESHQFFEVEAATVVTPNLMTFQLVTGYERFYIMGTYIPPNDMTGVDVLRTAWAACPADHTPLVMGDLDINFEHPRDAREEDIANLLDKINLVDSSCKFLLQWCKLQSAKKRWTW